MSGDPGPGTAMVVGEPPLRVPPGTAAVRFLEQAASLGDRPALREMKAAGGERDRSVTWAEWAESSRRFAAALIAGGHEAGTVAAILAGNRLVWPVADLGVLLAGGVSAGVYPTSAPPQVAHVLRSSGAAVAVVDTADQLVKIASVAAALPALRTVIVSDAEAAPVDGLDVVTLAEWLDRGDRAMDAGAGGVIAARTTGADPDDTALLIYTSGSTGLPKAARIPHRYLLGSAESVRVTLGLTAEDTSLSFLPFCHAAERIFGLYSRIHCGMEALLVPDHRRVWDAARAYGPTVFGGLPRFYEKAYEAIDALRAAAASDERSRWERVLELGRRRSRVRRRGGTVPATLEAEWRTAAAPFLAAVNDRFGGRVRVATSGGAVLPLEVAETLDALGLTVLGAYGLTEHLCVAFHRPDRYAFDSAGPPMPGTAIRTAPDGEILIRGGALTFGGYLGDDAATRAAFVRDEEGAEWLLTGDLGELDADGFLHVTGRKKDLIALSTGKKVAPQPIEARLVDEPWIGQAVLHGEGRKFVSALITLRRGAVEAWARTEAPGASWPDLLVHDRVVARVQAAVDRVNADLSRTERVRRFVILEDELTAAAGELTPTMKPRRDVVAERYAHLLDPLYR